MSDRQATMVYLKTELTLLFTGRGVRVHERTIISETNIYILYTHAASAAECSMGIIENDHAFMKFCIDKEREGTWAASFPITHMGRVFDDGTVKFRKIKGKTELECAEKLVQWFTKHREHILAVGAK